MVQLAGSHLPVPALTLDELVRQLEQLPAAPRVLPRLKLLLTDGNTAMSDVVEMVKLDPGISARVLQFGNSAYFSHGLRCYTVEEAINRVGYTQIFELVSTAVASQVLVRPLTTYGVQADDLWKRSIACALASEAIATRLGADRDIAYTIGLLHSIGMIAIDEWAAHHQPDLRFDAQSLPLEACEAERAALGFHQAEAGATLLRLWEFPQAMSEPVRWQYLPNGTAVHFQYAAMLHVAKWIRAKVLHPQTPYPHPNTMLLGKLKLSSHALECLAGEVQTKLKAIDIRLETEAKGPVSIAFPGGDRQIAQISHICR